MVTATIDNPLILAIRSDLLWSFKCTCDREIDSWILKDAGKRLTAYKINTILRPIYLKTVAAVGQLNYFWNLEYVVIILNSCICLFNPEKFVICLFNHGIFEDEYFAPSLATEKQKH